MALKPVKDFASFLTAEGSKPAEVLGQLLGAAGQDILSDLPVTTVDAIIATGLDPTATSQVRTLAYQVSLLLVTRSFMKTCSSSYRHKIVCTTRSLSNARRS